MSATIISLAAAREARGRRFPHRDMPPASSGSDRVLRSLQELAIKLGIDIYEPPAPRGHTTHPRNR